MFRRIIPLYIHIAYLFLGLLLAFALVSLGHHYFQTRQILMQDAEERFTLIGQLTIQQLEGLQRPAAISTDLLAQQRLSQASTLSQRLASVPYLVTMLTGAPSANSVYVGYNNGDLFRLSRWSAHLWLPQPAPARTRWILESVRHQTQLQTDRFFLADDLAILRQDTLLNQGIDSRSQHWFRQARQADQLVQTDPYRSREAEIGISLVKPMQNGAGVVGVDLSLTSLEQLLKSAALTPNMRLAIINDRDEVITSHQGTLFIVNQDGTSRLARLAETQLPMIQHLMQASKQARSDKLAFSSMGETWQGMRIDLPAADGSRLSLWMAAPHHELLASAITIRNQGFALSLLFLILAIVSAVLLARAAARPLDALTREARKIEQFDFSEPVRVNTFISDNHRSCP